MEKLTIMHKDIPVFSGMFDHGYLQQVSEFHDLSHLPVGCHNVFNTLDAGYFNQIWSLRQIPISRQNVKALLINFPGITFDLMAGYNAQANLSDNYWVKPAGSELSYSDVNFFENDFGDALLPGLLSNDAIYLPKPDLNTASCSTGGDAPKAWCVKQDGRRILYKASATAFLQEPYNEKIASKLLHVMGAKHVAYGLSQVKWNEGSAICSVCPCAVDINHDFVPASDILQSFHKLPAPGLKMLDDYIAFAKEYHVADIEQHLGYQILADYLLRNTDRHWNNFGLIRDAESLNFTGVMPIFDNGNTLYHNIARIATKQDAVSKMTKLSLGQDLSFIKDFTSDMRAATKQFPGIVEQVLESADLPRDRKAILTSVAEFRSDAVLSKFRGEIVLGRQVDYEL